MKKIVATLCAVMMVSPTHALIDNPDLDVPDAVLDVTVIGTLPGIEWMQLWVNQYPIMPSLRGVTSPDYYLDHLQLAIETTPKPKDPTTDVRTLCAIGRAALAHTVSTDDAVARGDAVRALVGVYNTVWAAKGMRKFFSIPGMKVDAVFTFADGGTERYYINPISTDNSTPIEGSLKPGDGVAKNLAC